MRKISITAILFFATLALPTSSSAVAIPFDSINRALISTMYIADTIIYGSNNVNNAIPTGAVVLYKTKTGHFGKLKVLSYGYNLWLRIVTYNNDGSVLAAADSVQIGGTNFCDLDSAIQTSSSQADFQWQQKTTVIRQITARNPVKLLLYYSPNNVVTNVTMTPSSPAIIADKQMVTVKFTYTTSLASGACIFFEPITRGPIGPVVANGALFYQFNATAGTDTGSSRFYIDTGSVYIDSVWVRMLDSSRTKIIFDSYVPASYAVTPDTAKNLVIPISISPPSPASLADTQRVTVGFLFRANEPTGVRIACMPITKGSLSFGAVWQGTSVNHSPAGTLSQFFSILSGTIHVDSIWVLMKDSANTKTLYQAYMPVSYMFTGPTNVVAKVNNAPPREYGCVVARDGTIRIEMPEAGFAEIKIYDARGRCMGIVAKGYLTAGEHAVKIGKVRGVAVVRGKVNGREFIGKVVNGE
jgi:hypothetical protein